MKKRICLLICIASFIKLCNLGAAIDLDTLSFGEIVAQGIASGAILLISAEIGGFIK